MDGAYADEEYKQTAQVGEVGQEYQDVTEHSASPEYTGEEELFTEIPAEYLLKSPSKPNQEESGRRSKHSETHDAMRNETYEKNIAQNKEGRQQSHFRVPVHRPLLPRNWDPVIGNVNGKRNSAESSLAPLFSRHDGEENAEAVKVGFLEPNTERRHEIEERKRNEPRAHGNPEAKRSANEPKKMPQLNRKVPKDFVPQCAAMETLATKSRNEETKRIGGRPILKAS